MDESTGGKDQKPKKKTSKQLLKEQREKEQLEAKKELGKQLEKLNERHAVIMLSGKCRILNEDYDPVFDRPDISFSSFNDFKFWYTNRRIANPESGKQGQRKTVSLSNEWINWSHRRKYNGMIFSPSKDIKGYYNLWKGFAFEPKQGDWSKFRSHIYNIVSCKNDTIYNWIIAWMAYMVQNPGGQRPGVALVLRGGQGVGKGFFLSGFGKLFGQHYMQVNNQKHLTSNFNNHLKNVLFLFVDEGFWAGSKSAEGILKGLVTEEYITIEQKFVDAIVFRNHLNIAMASNQNWVVPAGLDERRFFVIDISEDRKKDVPYFSKIHQELINGGYEAMLYDLLKHDGSNIKLENFPRTTALLDQIIESMNPVYKFWFEKLRSGRLMESENHWGCLIEKETLYKQYSVFCDTINMRYKKIPSQFGRQLLKICSDISTPYLKSSNIRKMHYEFPELEKCRDLFEKVVKIKVDWENDG